MRWIRVNSNFPDLALWRQVAAMAKAPLTDVICVALRLECLASRSDPPGSVADMSVPEFSQALSLRPKVVASIRLALEDPTVAWIDQDQIVDFSLRNTTVGVTAVKDPSAAERQRRHRAKVRRTLRELLLDASAAPQGAAAADLSTVTRDSRYVTRDVTLRYETNLKPSSLEDRARAYASEAAQKLSDRRAGTPNPGQSGTNPQNRVRAPPASTELSTVTRDSVTSRRDSGLVDNSEAGGLASSTDPQTVAQLWLGSEGKRIVAERLFEEPGRAATRVERWLTQQIDGDAVALVQVIAAADATDYVGARFHNLVVDGIRRRPAGPAQGELKLPPVPVAERKLGG